MSGDSGDSSSDFSAKPSCSRRITRRSKNGCSSSAAGAATTSQGAGGSGGKKKRRIVMRIEFDDDSDESSSASSSSGIQSDQKSPNPTNRNHDDDEIRPCSSRKLRGKIGKNTNFVFSSDDDVPGGGGNNCRRLRLRANNIRRNRQTLEDDDDDRDADGGCSSNGREIVRPVRNRKKVLISEDESDENDTPSTSQQKRDDENGFNSDSSSNELLEKCPICLLTFRAQEIGSPATCEHIFCANCIEAWSKNVQTCPIDRIEFDRIIVRESYENRELVREIKVSKTNGADKLNQDSDEDLTHCEVCNRTDREDVMLLCDSCNHGYHIDCLTPALAAIPEGSWFCDMCFESSDDSDMVDDLNVLYEDIRDMGIPESQYRVTEVYQPRILRTRQNERIRAAILSRTRSSARNLNIDVSAASSRTASASRSTRTVRNTARTTRTPKVRRRRRRRARQRTYVVEYDLNNYDEKFAIKTTKKVIKRRRRRRTRRTARSCRDEVTSGGRMTASKRLAEQLGVKSTDRSSRSAAASHTFSLFGNANDLEYFSDSDDGGGLQSEIEIQTGGGGTAAVQTSVRISNFRTHRSKKGLLSRLEREQPSSTPDLLSNIMDMQDRWHNASRHLDAVTIGQDGSLNLPPPSTSEPGPNVNISPANAPAATGTQPASGVNANEITQAPMYPRGGGGNNRSFNSGGGGNSGGGNQNNRYNNQSNYRGSVGGGSSGGGGQFRSSFGSSGTSGSGGSGNVGGNLFNMVGRGNFSFSSPSFNQNQNQNNDNNNPNNRDRFNQRNNNNNRNNRNSLPLFNNNNNQSNDNLSNQSPMQQQQQQRPIQQTQPLQPPPQFPIPALQSLQNTQMQPPPHQPMPLSMPMQPPVGLFSNLPPTSAPPPLFGPPNLPIPPPMLNQPPPIIPMHTQPPPVLTAALPPPLAAPPAFNSSLFKLTADYGNDEDDDSNCPNFSVYSMESLQVAKSDVNAAAEAKGDTPKEDDENEDLVQLSDDDEMTGTNEEIPLPPPVDNDKNKVDDTANSDLYEPDQPTIESEDETNDGVKEKDEDNDEEIESQPSPENDMELESQDTANERPGSENHDEDDEPDDTEKEVSAADSAVKANDEKQDGEGMSLLDIKLPEETPKVRRSEQRKGVLELYDDSDWEELNMERPTVALIGVPSKTPPLEGKSPESEKENDDVEGEIADIDGDKSDENEALTPAHPPRASSSAGEEEEEHEEDAEKPQEEDREQDRSYTPCLDEKNDNIEEGDDDGICTPELAGPSMVSGSNADLAKDDGHTPERVDDAGIGGMETELISEEDDGDKRDKGKRNRGKDREQFKKVSKNQKDRNYRGDKPLFNDRMKTRRRRSRSRTNDKENQGMQYRRAFRGRFKRRELPRYNVRNVVNQQRSFKDRYGRDTSRPPRSGSRQRRRRSFSRSVSGSKSRSRSISTPTKRLRRSFSISPSPPRFPVNRRQSMSPRRRSRSPINRSPPMRRQSRTPLRMRSRSATPVRRLPKRKQKRLVAKRSVSPINRARSLSRFTPRLSRSRTPPRHKAKRPKERKKKKNKKRQSSPSPRKSHRGSLPPNKRKRHHTPKDKSPVGDLGWSPSPSPPRNYMHDNISWTPPLASPAGVSRLHRDEAYNEFSIAAKPVKEKKKRDKKKKKSDKRRGDTIRNKDKRRKEQGNAPSKEVFASGNNILVSVSFNKEGNQPQQTTVVTLPPTREEVLASIRGRSKDRQAETQGKKKKKKDGRKRKKLDTKPVAIIDLERSPFQVTQEEADVIVLTDSEAGGQDDENLNVSRESANEMMAEMDHHHAREGSSHRTANSDKTPPLDRDRLQAIMEESYENAIQQQGPKTPPEPSGGIKFNLLNKNKKQVTRNVLHDEAELESDEHHEDEDQEDREQMQQNSNKIGPNTPPESGPCSPDVYDPFDPTKSPSMSPRSPTPPPDMSHDSAPDGDIPSKHSTHSTEDLRPEARMPAPLGPTAPEKGALNPVDLVMALMNNKANTSQDSLNKSNESQYSSGQAVVSLLDDNDKPEENPPNMGITVLSNVILSSGKPQHIPSISSPPLSKASSSQVHKPPQKITNILSGLPGLNNRHNGVGGGIDELVINDIESPYSPGSADYEDLFEPPPDTNGTKRRREKRGNNKVGDVFENLFGTSSPPPPGAAHMRLPSSRRHKAAAQHARNKHKMIVKVSKLPGNNTDDHVKVYDDLPNSAVELQVKDKFLRKLNRQERVVEEVKMILKPRFNRKQITKDDYKEIMRRAVPKICHSKSGEINPKKIKNLIEAYVRKFRQKHKKLTIPNTGQVSSAVKCAAYLKKL